MTLLISPFYARQNALRFGDQAALRVGQTLGMADYPPCVTGSAPATSGRLSKIHGGEVVDYLQADATATHRAGPPQPTARSHVC